MGIRLIVCMDFDTTDVREAYEALYLGMMTQDISDDGWESADEWYDENGEPGDVDELQQARMSVIQEHDDPQLQHFR